MVSCPFAPGDGGNQSNQRYVECAAPEEPLSRRLRFYASDPQHKQRDIYTPMLTSQLQLNITTILVKFVDCQFDSS